MSMSYAVRRDPQVADHAQVCAKLLGSYIHSARMHDGRSLEELAPKAGLTPEEWLDVERGALLVAWEQILLLATVLRLSGSWKPYLMKLWVKASQRTSA